MAVLERIHEIRIAKKYVKENIRYFEDLANHFNRENYSFSGRTYFIGLYRRNGDELELIRKLSEVDVKTLREAVIKKYVVRAVLNTGGRSRTDIYDGDDPEFLTYSENGEKKWCGIWWIYRMEKPRTVGEAYAKEARMKHEAGVSAYECGADFLSRSKIK